MNLIKATIATAAVITCCMGNEFPAKANPNLEATFNSSSKLMMYHADLPNQSGVCDYSKEAMSAAILLADRDKVKAVQVMRDAFDCDQLANTKLIYRSTSTLGYQ